MRAAGLILPDAERVERLARGDIGRQDRSLCGGGLIGRLARQRGQTAKAVGRRRIDLRAAHDVAVGAADRIDRQQEALDVEIALDGRGFPEIAVVRGDFVVPAVLELAPNARDDPVGFALGAFLARAKAKQVLTQRELEAPG